MLADAGIAVQARAPMTAAAKLVFGADYDKTRLTEFAAVMSHARRHDIAEGGLDAFIGATEGGIKGIVKAERALRKPAPQPDLFDQVRAELRARPALAHVQMDAGAQEFVLLLARAGADGALDIVARIDDDAALANRALRKAAA